MTRTLGIKSRIRYELLSPQRPVPLLDGKLNARLRRMLFIADGPGTRVGVPLRLPFRHLHQHAKVVPL